MNIDIYSEKELEQLGSCGSNVIIDKSVKLINPKNIFIGSNVRIDSWCFLSAGKNITIGSNVHLAINVHLAGNGENITIDNFCGISARTNIFTATDDYTEGWLTNPTIPDKYKKVRAGPVVLKKHVIIGCSSVIMPNCTLQIGCAIGALSFVNKNIPEYVVASGNPIRVICKRNKEKLLKMERSYLDNEINR